jgi:hypothetical protein
LPSNDKQTLVLLLLRTFRGFYGLKSYWMGETRHSAPSLRLFRPEQSNGVSPFRSSFGYACNATFLWLGSFCGDHSPTATSAPFLDQLVQSGSLISCPSVWFIAIIQILHLDYFSQHRPSKIPRSLSPTVGAGDSAWQAPALPALFAFRRGLTLVFLRLMEVTTALFMTSNLKVCPRVSYNVFWLLRHNSCLLLRPLMPLPVVVFFLRRSCCFEPCSLMLLLPAGIFLIQAAVKSLLGP